MNKKIITAFIAATLLVTTTAYTANAVDAPKSTIAILDTALDTGIPSFNGRIVHEVCILDWMSCPNGRNFQEGPGAASMPLNLISKNGFDHGTQMTSIFLANNPNSNVVFIRIIGATKAGARQTTSEATIVNALDWVAKNQSRFNIKAVSMSQGHHNLVKGANYCPNTPNTALQINRLVSMDVPVFLPTGNLRDKSRISWPACIDASISIGSSNENNDIAMWNNIDISKTDFYALGVLDAILPGGTVKRITGTSASVQVAAAQWLQMRSLKPTLSYQQAYDLFKSTSVNIPGGPGISGSMINLQAAING
jgi:hypothetical protein